MYRSSEDLEKMYNTILIEYPLEQVTMQNSLAVLSHQILIVI